MIREFWIHQGQKRGQDFVSTGNETRQYKGIHVIEKTAYDAALDRIADLERRLNQNQCNSGHTTLPIALWDCPECVKEHIARYKNTLESVRIVLDNHALSAPAALIEIRDTINKLRPQ